MSLMKSREKKKAQNGCKKKKNEGDDDDDDAVDEVEEGNDVEGALRDFIPFSKRERERK